MRWAACGQSVRVPSESPAVMPQKPPGIPITQAARVATLAQFRARLGMSAFARRRGERMRGRDFIVVREELGFRSI
jgi:hypothetical protein